MTGELRRGGPTAVVVCVLALAGPVAARVSEPIEYQAASGCPDRGAFLEAAARKAPRAKEGLGAAAFKVEVTASLAGYTGVLERRPVGDAVAPAPRVLSAARCEDVVEALALTLALSLLPPSEPAGVVAASAPPPAPAPRASRLALGTGLQAGRFVSGAPMLGAAVLVGLARAGRPGWSLAPEGRLRLSWSRSDVALTPGRARFQLLSGALELCPLHVGAGPVRAGLCGLVEAGALDGEGIGVAHPQRARATWLSLGGGPELELALTRRWRLLGTAFATRPLRQTRFVFADPEEPVAGTAGVALSGALALAVHFP